MPSKIKYLNVPKDTKNTHYYMLKSYINIVYNCLSHNTKYNENNIYKYKCIISSYLSDLKLMYNLNSIKKFIRGYKPNGEQFSILDILGHLMKKYIYNENAKNIKSEFSDLTKTKKRCSKRSKKTYKINSYYYR
jgi:hypothetical protein